MAFQLVYTSASRLLQAGRTGFGTVAKHEEIAPWLQNELERVSQFSRLPGLDPERVIFSHTIFGEGDRRSHVLTRIQDAGADYTGRTNHIAHHIVLDQTDITRAIRQNITPVDVLHHLEAQDLWKTSWTEDSRMLGVEEIVDIATIPKYISLPANNYWAQLVPGRPECAALLAPGRISEACWILYPPNWGSAIIYAIGESLILHPNPWDITFTNDLQPTDNEQLLAWRCLPPGSPLQDKAQSSVRPCIDLNIPASVDQFMQEIPNEFREEARTGFKPRPTPRKNPMAGSSMAQPAQNANPHEQPPVSSQAVPPSRPPTYATPSLQRRSAAPRKTKKSKGPIIIGCIVALALIAFGAFLWDSQSKEVKRREELKKCLQAFKDASSLNLTSVSDDLLNQVKAFQKESFKLNNNNASNILENINGIDNAVYNFLNPIHIDLEKFVRFADDKNWKEAKSQIDKFPTAIRNDGNIQDELERVLTDKFKKEIASIYDKKENNPDDFEMYVGYAEELKIEANYWKEKLKESLQGEKSKKNDMAQNVVNASASPESTPTETPPPLPKVNTTAHTQTTEEAKPYQIYVVYKDDDISNLKKNVQKFTSEPSSIDPKSIPEIPENSEYLSNISLLQEKITEGFYHFFAKDVKVSRLSVVCLAHKADGLDQFLHWNVYSGNSTEAYLLKNEKFEFKKDFLDSLKKIVDINGKPVNFQWKLVAKDPKDREVFNDSRGAVDQNDTPKLVKNLNKYEKHKKNLEQKKVSLINKVIALSNNSIDQNAANTMVDKPNDEILIEINKGAINWNNFFGDLKSELKKFQDQNKSSKDIGLIAKLCESDIKNIDEFIKYCKNTFDVASEMKKFANQFKKVSLNNPKLGEGIFFTNNNIIQLDEQKTKARFKQISEDEIKEETTAYADAKENLKKFQDLRSCNASLQISSPDAAKPFITIEIKEFPIEGTKQ